MSARILVLHKMKKQKKNTTNPVTEDDTCDALWVPEELVNIIIPDDRFVILFASHEFPVDDLITLVPDKPVKRLYHSSQVKPFGNRLHSALAL